jgi:hypothetical protein
MIKSYMCGTALLAIATLMTSASVANASVKNGITLNGLALNGVALNETNVPAQTDQSSNRQLQAPTALHPSSLSFPDGTKLVLSP